jgi:hypothetical protein
VKACFKCGVVQPLTEFYRHPQMGDGHLNKCKTCTKKDATEHRERMINDPKWIEKERERNREKTKRYRASGLGKKSIEAMRQWRMRNRHKVKAQSIAHRAEKTGVIVQPANCQRCGCPGNGKLDKHHHDYNLPLDVKWVCKTCHGIEHRKPATEPVKRRSAQSHAP